MKTTVFTFWEPKAAVIPYIGLCLKTWEAAFKAYNVVVLDHSNVSDYLGDASYDMEVLKRLTLSVQKDAIMVAVLRKHGGVFLDADTLAVGDIAPLVNRLGQTEVVMFGMHMAALVARPDARLLNRWYAGIQKKLATLARGKAPRAAVPWDFAGNSVLLSTMEAIIDTHEDKPFPIALADRAVEWLKTSSAPGRNRIPFARLTKAVVGGRRMLYFKTIYRRHLTMLDRKAHGFMPELLHYRHEAPDAKEKYRRYWFQSGAGLDTALLPNQTLIGLHNSWTPEWYKQLSEGEVLAHSCLLSRTLSHLLDR
jgi:Capsular polysaccharide synthesis protein